MRYFYGKKTIDITNLAKNNRAVDNWIFTGFFLSKERASVGVRLDFYAHPQKQTIF